MFLACAALLAAALPATAQTELIANDKFGDGATSWTLQASRGATAVMDVEKEGDEPVLFVKVEVTEDSNDDVRIHRVFGDIEQGKNYRLTYKAKASEATTIVPFIYPLETSNKVLFRTEIKLDDDWKEFSHTFAGRETASNCVLGFAQLGKKTNTYSFKDIELLAE